VVGSSRDAQMADTSRQFGVLRANGRGARHRRHPTAAPQPLCSGQGMHACTGILANHESPLRPKRFVTQKIIEGVRAIKAGRASTIELGNLDIRSDWGWAPDYVQAMALMLQAVTPIDYLIASGTTTSLSQFAQAAFAAADLDLAEHLVSVEVLKRPADLDYSALKPQRIEADLGWRSKRTVREIVGKMYGDEMF
jgi:GDPmannose 4,6-dehydratase